ncbi:hypothetical protein MPC4_110144 [Methylocella tundrae]|uniref:Uncharacterized protein n=1 Tax=Methylocella tundrae TaxID=227605 RepID=A0A8B6M248_METTU|nr:hypothetical protein MPC1_500003 [Methylocella tundrae]VTZ48844.1 hypothetical protein MPC4_110144 [Methylocella tundrae]
MEFTKMAEWAVFHKGVPHQMAAPQGFAIMTASCPDERSAKEFSRSHIEKGTFVEAKCGDRRKS